MNIERDKFLTESIGECWHENELTMDANDGSLYWRCRYCHKEDIRNIDFSTWEGFGRLKSFMVEHPEHEAFFDTYIDYLTEHAEGISETFNRIQPDFFAYYVYEFLQGLI